MGDNQSQTVSHLTPIAPTAIVPSDQASRPLRNLHVKRIPWPIWAKARNNALLSNVPFRDFIIALLERSTPLPYTTVTIPPNNGGRE